MASNFVEKLMAENDFVLKPTRQSFLLSISGVPDAGFAHEVEAHPMHDGRSFSLRVGAKEDRRAEDAFERGDQASVLRPTLLQAESVKHFRRAAEPNNPVLLPNGERGQKDRHQSVLPPWQAVGRVSGHLKQELSIATLVKELPCCGLSDGKSAKDKGSR